MHRLQSALAQQRHLPVPAKDRAVPWQRQAASEVWNLTGNRSQAQHVLPHGPQAAEASILVGLISTCTTEHDSLKMPGITAAMVGTATQEGSRLFAARSSLAAALVSCCVHNIAVLHGLLCRKVPLSEGRVHQDSNSLECAYHGKNRHV